MEKTSGWDLGISLPTKKRSSMLLRRGMMKSVTSLKLCGKAQLNSVWELPGRMDTLLSLPTTILLEIMPESLPRMSNNDELTMKTIKVLREQQCQEI
ncbi:hypothetical protein WDU94_000850 [Cyamophila willieti]